MIIACRSNNSLATLQISFKFLPCISLTFTTCVLLPLPLEVYANILRVCNSRLPLLLDIILARLYTCCNSLLPS